MGPARFELATSCSGGKRSIQLSYGPSLGGQICLAAQPSATAGRGPGPGSAPASYLARFRLGLGVFVLSQAASAFSGTLPSATPTMI